MRRRRQKWRLAAAIDPLSSYGWVIIYIAVVLKACCLRTGPGWCIEILHNVLQRYAGTVDSYLVLYLHGFVCELRICGWLLPALFYQSFCVANAAVASGCLKRNKESRMRASCLVVATGWRCGAVDPGRLQRLRVGFPAVVFQARKCSTVVLFLRECPASLTQWLMNNSRGPKM